jgi:NADPH:quinone reductase-like Zn-dependent oxidoreductase
VGVITKQWTVDRKSGHDGLSFHERVKVPELGDHNILVKIHGASLNYRGVVIGNLYHVIAEVRWLSQGTHPHPIHDGVVPGSGGAGMVEAIGLQVTRSHLATRWLPCSTRAISMVH